MTLTMGRLVLAATPQRALVFFASKLPAQYRKCIQPWIECRVRGGEPLCHVILLRRMK
jgi:hypothetical protein